MLDNALDLRCQLCPAGLGLVHIAHSLGLMNDHRLVVSIEPERCGHVSLRQQGLNRVSVVVCGTLKNTLGPHHNNPSPGTAWPSQFQRGAEGGRPPGKDYSLLDYGLMQDFLLVHWK